MAVPSKRLKGKKYRDAKAAEEQAKSGASSGAETKARSAVDIALCRIAAAARDWGVPAASLLRQGRHGPLWRGIPLDGAHRSGLEAAVAELEARRTRLERGRRAWEDDGARRENSGGDPAARIQQLEAGAQAAVRGDGPRVDALSLLRDTRALARA